MLISLAFVLRDVPSSLIGSPPHIPKYGREKKKKINAVLFWQNIRLSNTCFTEYFHVPMYHRASVFTHMAAHQNQFPKGIMYGPHVHTVQRLSSLPCYMLHNLVSGFLRARRQENPIKREITGIAIYHFLEGNHQVHI